jgi:hypothetical protein
VGIVLRLPDEVGPDLAALEFAQTLPEGDLAGMFVPGSSVEAKDQQGFLAFLADFGGPRNIEQSGSRPPNKSMISYNQMIMSVPRLVSDRETRPARNRGDANGRDCEDFEDLRGLSRACVRDRRAPTGTRSKCG